MFWPLPALVQDQSWILSQDRKTVILNPVTRHRKSSMGSWTAAKRGYDTESMAWSQPHPPPLPFSVWESGDQVVSQWGRVKPQNYCWHQDMVAVVCRMLSVIPVLDMKTSALITCLSYIRVSLQTDYNRIKMICSHADACYTCFIRFLLHHTQKKPCSKAEQKLQMCLASYPVVLTKEEVPTQESAPQRWIKQTKRVALQTKDATGARWHSTTEGG